MEDVGASATRYEGAEGDGLAVDNEEEAGHDRFEGVGWGRRRARDEMKIVVLRECLKSCVHALCGARGAGA